MSRQRKGIVDIINSTVEPSEKARSNTKSRLLEYHDIPSWQQENEFILTGYRSTSGSVRESLESLLYLHNETGMNFVSALLSSC